MNVLPSNNGLINENGEDAFSGRLRMAFTGECDDFPDCDDLPSEDDILTEIIPEERRLQRLLAIQSPFQEVQEGSDPYLSSCRLLANAVQIPVSWVSLVYDEFQWFKASVGLETDHTERCWSFCAHTFTPRTPEVLYVPDALEDDRFHENFLVHNAPNIRFYCGVPLVTQDGVRLGALCIIDTKPRVMSQGGFQFLINLAELTVRELLQTEIGHTYKPSCPALPVVALSQGTKLRRFPTAARLRRLREQWFEKGLTEGVLIIHTEPPKWEVVWTNSQWDAWTKNSSILTSPDIWSVLQPVKGETGKQMQRTMSQKLASHECVSCSFLARVVGIAGKSSLFVSCEAVIATRPMKDVKYNIRMPSDDVGPPNADPIVFDGDKYIIIFVRHAQEGLAASKTSSFSDEDVTLPASIGKPGCLLPEVILESKKALVTKTGVAQSGSAYGTPAAATTQALVKTETAVPAIALDQSVSQSVRARASGILTIFQSFDREQTGRIRKELLVTLVKKILSEYNEAVPDDMIERLVDSCCIDRDGFIKYDDFVAVLIGEKKLSDATKASDNSMMS